MSRKSKNPSKLAAYDICGDEFYCYPWDVDLLKLLARRLPANPVIVNIGAGFGTSALAFMEAREDAFVFSIDIGLCGAEEKHLKAAGMWNRHRVVRVLGHSQEVGKHWPGPVDMVFVDGGHHFPGVYEDAVVWIPKIKAGGIIAFHDYGELVCPEVKPAVDDILENHAVGERLTQTEHVGTLIAFEVT